MKSYKDIVLNIIEEYIKLKMKKSDKKSMGRHKSRPKSSSKET